MKDQISKIIEENDPAHQTLIIALCSKQVSESTTVEEGGLISANAEINALAVSIFEKTRIKLLTKIANNLSI